MVLIPILMMVSASASAVIQMIPSWRKNLLIGMALFLHLYCTKLDIPYFYGALYFYGPIIAVYFGYRLALRFIKWCGRNLYEWLSSEAEKYRSGEGYGTNYTETFEIVRD